MLEACIKNGKILTVSVLIFCVLGIVACLSIPIQMIPDLEVRTISVITQWPGATPQDVENEILIEQERFLRTLPNLSRMESIAATGKASIELEFPYETDLDNALIRVANALDQVTAYPENVDQPKLFTSSFSETAFIYLNLTPAPGNPLKIDINMISDFVENQVRPSLERINGVSQIELRGGSQRQVQILVDPAKLSQRGISLSDIRSKLRERNRDTSGGDINDGKRRFLLRTVGRFDDLSQLGELIISRRGDTLILLKDVADIKLGHFEIRDLSYANNQQSMTLAIKREPGSNVIAIKRDVMATVTQLQNQLLTPNGLQLELLSDDVRYVSDSIINVGINLLIGAVLAAMTMYLFLRSGRATIIAVTGIPLCTLTAFLGLLLFDRTVNVISLAGVAFAIGMTLDNSIVVLENIEQAKRRGLNAFDSALSGVREVWPAVLASTLTTIIVFAPIIFIKEEAGQLYSDIAIAISSAIFASLLYAIAIIPTASAQFGFGKAGLNEVQRLGRWLTAINWVSANQRRRLACIALTILLTLVAAWQFMPAAEYLPEGEEPKAFSFMIAPPGYNLAEINTLGKDIRQQLSQSLNADPERFDRQDIKIPALKYFYVMVSSNRLMVMSEPTRHQDIDAMMNAITTLFKSYPGMRAFAARGSIITSNQGGTRAVNLDLSGPNLENLYTTANQVMTRAKALFENPQINTQPSALSFNQPLIQIEPHWPRLADIDMSAEQLGFIIAALSDGAYIDEFFMDDAKVDIYLYANTSQAQNIRQLVSQPIVTASGTVLPLSALASFTQTSGTDTLRRVDGRRTVTLSIIPPRAVALETAVEKIRNELITPMKTAGELGQDITLSVSGAADQLDATRDALALNFALALILIYLILVAILKHWRYPLLILSTVPLGIAGSLVMLVLINGSGTLLAKIGFAPFNQPFDMITMLGFVILLGTVVNNPILIIEQTRKNLANTRCTIEHAVQNAVSLRLRPILMSSSTTILGLAPLVFIPGEGTELYRGLGIIVLAGILCSTVVTLTFLPSLLISYCRYFEPRSNNAPI